MAFLILDTDRSLSTIGSNNDVVKLAGIPAMPVDGGLEEISTLLNSLFTSKKVAVEHPLFKSDKTEWKIVSSDLAKEHKLNGIVIDTITTAGSQTRSDMISKARPNSKGHKAMEMQDWGVYGEMLSKFVQTLSRLPIWTIVNAHADYSMDDKLGTHIITPAVKGSGKFEIARFFDIILYSRVIKTKEKTDYYWVTKPDDRMPMAKDRANILEAIIPQDHGAILKMYNEIGIKTPKILVIADSGQGKTHSLKTLENQ